MLRDKKGFNYGIQYDLNVELRFHEMWDRACKSGETVGFTNHNVAKTSPNTGI